MARTFAYLRVSTPEQTTGNLVQEITASGFRVEPHRIVSETVSRSVAISQRPEFARLADRLEPGDVLVVTKLDRLGRNAMDVAATVAGLAEAGIKDHCRVLGGVDLTSAAGKLTMYVINAVAEIERDLLIERTQASLRRAITEGRHPGRPHRPSGEERQSVLELLATGASISSLARKFDTSRQTIMCVRDGVPACQS